MTKDSQIGSTRMRKGGLSLYGLNNETGEIYKLKIRDKGKKELGMKKNSKGNFIREGKFKADVNPNHKLIWALNLKNAYRKFANDPANLPIMAKQNDEG